MVYVVPLTRDDLIDLLRRVDQYPTHGRETYRLWVQQKIETIDRSAKAEAARREET